MSTAKPPLGLMPREVYELQRIADISAAIIRYLDDPKSRCQIPVEWISEYNELAKKYCNIEGMELAETYRDYTEMEGTT